jgi:hypothetical protein
MKLSLHIAPAPVAAASRNGFADNARALDQWYADHPAVRRLWAIAPEPSDPGLRIVVMLDPSPDGDETAPAWFAHGHRWSADLQRRLRTDVDLECIDGPVPDEFEIDGKGVVVASLCWRDATLEAY